MHIICSILQVFIQFARNQQDQIEGIADDHSSADTESSTRYANPAYAAQAEDIVLTVDEKPDQKLPNGAEEQSFNTYL